MAENFKLPGSSYEELIKIIKAYSTGKTGAPMALEDIAQATGMDKTIISRNNGFLIQLGFVSDGNKKIPTQTGSDLGRAYTLKMEEQITHIWRTIIENDEFLSRMLSAVKIRNGMEKASFLNHILYSSGSSTNNRTRTGANTIIEIYKVALMVIETDGKVMALGNISDKNSESIKNSQETLQSTKASSLLAHPVKMVQNDEVSISININIDVKPDQLDSLVTVKTTASTIQ